jgi:hypothetical protein
MCADVIRKAQQSTNGVCRKAANGGPPSPRWEPQRGIRLVEARNRPKPFGVQWLVDGRRKTSFFRIRTEQVQFAKQLAADVKENGIAAYRADMGEVRELRALRAHLPADVPLEAVLACWERHGSTRPALLIRDAIPQYLEAKKAENLDPNTLSHYRSALDRLIVAFGDHNVQDVEREDLQAWLTDLDAEDSTCRTYFVRARGFFSWLKFARLITEHPFDGLRTPKVIPKEITLSTPDDLRLLFAVNAPVSRELCGRLACEAFAGIRFESVADMQPSDIKFELRGILLPADQIKTRRRKFIQNLPDCLWKWLEWSRPAEWTMTPRQYLEAKSLAFVRANIPHPRNCLRKSFATYHLALHGDAGKTAAILCHTNLRKLIEDYNGVASADRAAPWFTVLPVGKSPDNTQELAD